MGFLSRLRQGSAYGPPPAAGRTAASAKPASAPVIEATPNPPAEPPGPGNRTGASTAMPALGRPLPGPLTTTAERAFMEGRRGSSE